MENNIFIGDNGSYLIIQYNWNHDYDEYDNLERIWELLGDHDIVQCNEINPPGNLFSYMVSGDRIIYFLKDGNINEIKDTNKVVLYAEGTLEQFVDINERSHREFLDWHNND